MKREFQKLIPLPIKIFQGNTATRQSEILSFVKLGRKTAGAVECVSMKYSYWRCLWGFHRSRCSSLWRLLRVEYYRGEPADIKGGSISDARTNP